MSYIAPNSTVWILRNVRLDPRYEDTLYPVTTSDQSGYFLTQSKIAKYLPANSYQRKGREYLRIAAKYEEVYDCNYMVYRNYSHENKYFYAFITSVEYVNEDTTEIRYEIDVMQTWHFDYSLGRCFVEREHSATDNIGDNVLPEPVPVTDWTYSGRSICPVFDYTQGIDYLPVAVVTSSENASDMSGDQRYGSITWTGSRVYNGVELYGFHVPYKFINPTPDIRDFLKAVVNNNKIDGVSSIFMCPGKFVAIYKQTGGGSGYYLSDAHIENPYSWNIPKENAWTYTYGSKSGPRNKKLYTFQFNKLIITDHNEAHTEYPYEYFTGSNTNCEFKIVGSITPDPQFACIPKNFKGMPEAGMYQLVSGGYPQCAFNIDTFSNWIAQNKYKLIGQSVNAGLGVVSGAALGASKLGPTGAALGTLGGLTYAIDLLSTMAQVESLPNELRGSIGNSINLETGMIGFSYYYARAIDECLAMADDFFDMYGYNTCLVKVPNRYVRERWTYTKTNGCRIYPNNNKSIPADDARKIESIYDKGIRFWVYGDEIGNYNLSNNPNITG